MTLTVGDMLRQTREKQNISLEQLQKLLRVRKHLLVAIEQNNWKPFSSKIYISGIIKSYASAVGLEEKKALAFFRRDYETVDDLSLKRRVSSRLFRPVAKTYTVAGLVLLGLVFMLYFGYQLSIFLLPPKITIVAPQQTQFKRRDKVTITGRTEKEAVVTIFGTRVYPNENGVFSYDLPLKNGLNKVVIQAIGANGKKAVITKEYVLIP